MYSWNDSGGLNNVTSSYAEGPVYDANSFPANVAAQGTTQQPLVFSNQLVRRNQNNQVARGHFTNPSEWQDTNNPIIPQSDFDEDEEQLEQKALEAKKEAQRKRKQIPPFVQKLSSFLDESNNTDLIRWSDDGRSFIVLDEDEFAKTLIPELFKHNNYASFVRQLNMYGFHKKVGLSDNSMRASEKKSKTPSEYWNKYFRRGRPELLWLIQKPKNPPSTAKRKRGEDDKGKGAADSDEEGKKYGPDGENSSRPQLPSLTGTQDMALIPRSEIQGLRQELQQLQNQQRFISGVIQNFRRSNDQLRQQTMAFQKMHERHESSINAILTFLATFYNRSLEGQGQNMQDMFAHVMPQTNQTHGSVVDVGEDFQMDPQQAQPGRYTKKPLALLPAPVIKDATFPPSRVINSSRPALNTQQKRTSQPRVFSQNQGNAQPSRFTEVSASPTIKDEVATPDSTNLPETPTMIDVLNSVNASNTPTGPAEFDFSSALSNYQNADGNTPLPLTPQQRDDMLSLMVANTPGNGDNPLSASATAPQLPSLEQFDNSQEQLDMLQKLQEQQASKVQHLADRLQPLSPTGSIPGLEMGNFVGDPGQFDLNSFINSDDYFPDQGIGDTADTTNIGDSLADHSNGNGNLNLDLNWDLPSGTNPRNLDQGYSNQTFDNTFEDGLLMPSAADGGGRVESVSSEATSPANTLGGDEDLGREAASPRKRLRRG
ncbi:hypothetical protein M501DRAFT_929319 [Patellaria atrata CBS 101060]|uniref:HSF-type DNA-binding domain-containing protein n=1 Tax=Patellaria atrata CBS 101060 TaxID=1346257 RepID=A0A9P4SFF0_9PEZI|nr:hypothetical protein M501DRAFT_929319 [Patellaria atrata CBS 101060]